MGSTSTSSAPFSGSTVPPPPAAAVPTPSTPTAARQSRPYGFSSNTPGGSVGSRYSTGRSFTAADSPDTKKSTRAGPAFDTFTTESDDGDKTFRGGAGGQGSGTGTSSGRTGAFATEGRYTFFASGSKSTGTDGGFGRQPAADTGFTSSSTHPRFDPFKNSRASTSAKTSDEFGDDDGSKGKRRASAADDGGFTQPDSAFNGFGNYNSTDADNPGFTGFGFGFGSGSGFNMDALTTSVVVVLAVPLPVQTQSIRSLSWTVTMISSRAATASSLVLQMHLFVPHVRQLAHHVHRLLALVQPPSLLVHVQWVTLVRALSCIVGASLASLASIFDTS